MKRGETLNTLTSQPVVLHGMSYLFPAEACRRLHCTRGYISYLCQTNRLAWVWREPDAQWPRPTRLVSEMGVKIFGEMRVNPTK